MSRRHKMLSTRAHHSTPSSAATPRTLSKYTLNQTLLIQVALLYFTPFYRLCQGLPSPMDQAVLYFPCTTISLMVVDRWKRS